MARITYASEHYKLITREEMDEGMDYQIKSLKPDPSLKELGWHDLRVPKYTAGEPVVHLACRHFVEDS